MLAPFLACSSPADFLALQQRVDMPRLVMRLNDWSAVRLGSLGPVREEAAGVLNGKRTSFLLQSPERYGAANAEVLAHFVLDSSHDDDLRDILSLMARDKRLQEVLELLPSLGPALEERESSLRPTRRGTSNGATWAEARLARAGMRCPPFPWWMEPSRGSWNSPRFGHSCRRPIKRRSMWWSASNSRGGSRRAPAVGLLDHMTFGVPLGFYSLVAGTGHGAYALGQGRYEQAVRELTPAVLLVTVYAGGKGRASCPRLGGVRGVGRGCRVGWR
ncbi:hypothetical protein ACN28S_62690 [Cystobacter fuscus]